MPLVGELRGEIIFARSQFLFFGNDESLCGRHNCSVGMQQRMTSERQLFDNLKGLTGPTR